MEYEPTDIIEKAEEIGEEYIQRKVMELEVKIINLGSKPNLDDAIEVVSEMNQYIKLYCGGETEAYDLISYKIFTIGEDVHIIQGKQQDLD